MQKLLDPEVKNFSLTSILSRQMSRKEFLGYVGIVVLTVTGVTGIISTLTNPQLFSKRYPKQVAGYGASNYGGVEKKTGGLS